MEIKALVVDNNPVLLRAVSAILLQEGCTVHTADTGLAALEVIDDFAPDIVFTDLIMPMVSGEQLCRILRNTQKYEKVFIVILSAIVLEDIERILREIPYDICIAKGSLQEIRQHLQHALRVYAAEKTKFPGTPRLAARIPEGLQPSHMTSELLIEKYHLTEILSNLEEGILELNFQGKVIAANSSALKIFSCREETIIGMPLLKVIDWEPFNEAVHEWVEQQLLACGMGKYDIVEDAPLFLDNLVLTASFVPIQEKGSLFGLCILRDISRQFNAEKYQKELDNALKLVKKMDAMSCMAGGFAHDFNNLLTVICGNLDIATLHDERRSALVRRQMLQQAKQAALVAVDLTRQISCFSNFGIVSRENVPIESLVKEVVANFFKAGSDLCRIKVIAPNALVHGDPQELSQALVRVLQNAVEASAGQKLDVIIDEDDFATPQLMAGQYVPAGKYVRIDIRDAGRGISPEQIFRIFDPYYSTKERGAHKGVGLGLTVVYAILRNHGGYVVVNSVLNKWTIVSFYLPAVAESQSQLAVHDAPLAVDRFVLLIEPDEQMAEVGKIMLGYLGFSVTAVADRAGAIRELQRFSGKPRLPLPLVIIAHSDKNDESAVETCRILHEMDAGLKVIAMSGMILDPVMQNCREYGFVNTLPKPFTMDSLKHIIHTVLAS
ncbi:response regulator [Desulfopila sp. IMCC35006]|uniref:ATP-binding response regulator n=1 Tax=Desulfopila sp. IMCC35006 TaxID=2569542 RepID=UPI0010ABBDCF|nr:response regulator [Desulfopila sp. IMCC35006]TKB27613.1 response regulator [Desulfopila sp. IMCC35006]